jgi:GLPGLI family protein
MKRFFFGLILCIPFFANSQIGTGVATYGLYITMDEEIMKADKKYGYIQKAIDVSRQLEYKLFFKGKESNFYQQKNDSLDKISVNMANSLSEVSKNIYINLNTNTLINEINADGFLVKKNEFVVKDSISMNWEVKNESKLIGEYMCHKATTTKKVQKTDREVIETITAWFCPALPYAFGPSKYAGLPGLILELQEKNIVFVIKSLRLNNNEEYLITVPTAKKEISQAEYNKIIDERFQTLESMSKQK